MDLSTKTGQMSLNDSPIQVEQRSVGADPPAPPSTFTLTKVSGRGIPLAPCPSYLKRHRPCLQAIPKQVLESLDDHATQVSKSDHNDVRELMWDLIYSKNMTAEIQKVRVIVKWMTVKNLKAMNFYKYAMGSPEDVIMGLKTGKSTDAVVFDTLCSYAGLHSKTVGGYAKGAGYQCGMKFNPGSNRHSWNVVCIDNTWCLVDTHLANLANVIREEPSDDGQHELNEFFFLPDPEQLIYTHFPDEPKCQLLDRQISLEEFENMPHVNSQFFKFGLDFVTNKAAVLYGGGENIKIRYPDNKMNVAFIFKLTMENGEDEYDRIKLSRFGMLERADGVATFHLRLPMRGTYILNIFAKEDVPDNRKRMYDQICDFKIIQEENPHPTPEPFPPCSYPFFGPGSDFDRYNLRTTQTSAFLNTQDGKCELRFRLPKKLQFMAKLKSNTADDEELQGFITHRIEGNTAFFTATAPGTGEYGLEIFANDPEKEGNTLHNVAQYIIRCFEETTARPLPKLPPGFLGANPKFQELGMTTSSHHDPVIHLQSNFVTINIRTADPLSTMIKLISCDSGDTLPNNVFTHTKNSVLTIMVSLPRTGFYKLQLFASPAGESEQLIGVYNYLIDCQQTTQDVFPFPKQYTLWTEGCYMDEPVTIQTCQSSRGQQISTDHLPRNVNFRVTVPKAKAVAVVVQDKWYPLANNIGKEWSGSVDLSSFYGTDTTVTLNAKYRNEGENYSTLLEYII